MNEMENFVEMICTGSEIKTKEAWKITRIEIYVYIGHPQNKSNII